MVQSRSEREALVRLIISTTLLLAGCGSHWDIRKGDNLGVGCAAINFYPDADEDGWGDPGAEPAVMCNADVEAGLTASNARDCDDGDIAITGQVGEVCPDGLVVADGGAIGHGGVALGESEFAYVFGTTAPVVRHAMATNSCGAWGGVDDQGADLGSLATFSAIAELDAVLSALDGALPAGLSYAGFVGIGWEGELSSGAWSFVDESGDGLITSDLDWCGVEPTPGDFFPLLNINDPDHAAAIEEQLPELRLALVRQDSGSWCLGLPWEAIPAGVQSQLDADPDYMDPDGTYRYTTSDAHLICKRPQPDATAHVEYVVE